MKKIGVLVSAFLVFSFVSCASNSKADVKTEEPSPVAETPVENAPETSENETEIETEENKTSETESQTETAEQNKSESENSETSPSPQQEAQEESENEKNEDASDEKTSKNEEVSETEKQAEESDEFDFENAELITDEVGFYFSDENNEEPENEDRIEEENKKEVPVEVVTEKEVLQPDTPKTDQLQNTAQIAQNDFKKTSQTDDKNAQNNQNETSLDADENAENNVESSSITDVSDVTVEVESENADENEEQEEIVESPPIIPSRSVTVLKGQYLDVNYPGSGWVYLGEIDDEGKNEKKMTYFGRKLGSANTSFSLRSRLPGTTVLHFYKNDNLTGTYIDDYLEVTIEDRTASASARTTAPSYAEVVPKKPEKPLKAAVVETSEKTEKKEADKKTTASAPSVSNSKTVSEPKAQETQKTPDFSNENTGEKTIVQTTESTPTPSSPVVSSSVPPSSDVKKTPSSNSLLPEKEDELLAYAQKCYDGEKYAEALEAVRKYLDISGSKTDEALYLQGLIYEADSPVRNIRNAIDCFDSVSKNYPSSQFWQKARNRSIYLKRFYVEIR